jgi:hypothetical protein
MTLISETHLHHLPAIAEKVFDLSGAGDTVNACLSTAAAAKYDLLAAAQIANAAASIVGEKVWYRPNKIERAFTSLCARGLRARLVATTQRRFVPISPLILETANGRIQASSSCLQKPLSTVPRITAARRCP